MKRVEVTMTNAASRSFDQDFFRAWLRQFDLFDGQRLMELPIHRSFNFYLFITP